MNRKIDSFLSLHPKDNAFMIMVAISDVIIIIAALFLVAQIN